MQRMTGHFAKLPSSVALQWFICSSSAARQCMRTTEALRKAAKRGKFDNVVLLLHAGADIHALDDDALCRAAGNAILAERGLDTIRLLLTCGANVHAADDAPLINAAGGYSAHAVALLLDHGASIHAQGDRALHAAIQCSSPDIVRLLLDRGADLHAGSGRALKLARSVDRTKEASGL